LKYPFFCYDRNEKHHPLKLNQQKMKNIFLYWCFVFLDYSFIFCALPDI